jgi:hypothetical protein
MKKNLVCLLVFLTCLKTSPAFATSKLLISCDNDVSISFETNIPSTMSSAIKTLYKAHIKNKNIIRHLGVSGSSNGLELQDSSFSSPQHSRLSFSAKGFGRELKITQLDRGSLFSFEVVSPQEIFCAQEACTSGCYAGDTPTWTCVDLRVTPESTLYNESAYCKIGPSK